MTEAGEAGIDRRLARIEGKVEHLVSAQERAEVRWSELMNVHKKLGEQIVQLDQRAKHLEQQSSGRDKEIHAMHLAVEENTRASARTRVREELIEATEDNRWGRTAVVISGLTFAVLVVLEVLPRLFSLMGG